MGVNRDLRQLGVGKLLRGIRRPRRLGVGYKSHGWIYVGTAVFMVISSLALLCYFEA